MQRNFEGSKYQETKDIWGSDLVKIIKADVKEAFPQYKVLCSKELYAGGWTIHTTLKGTGMEKYVAGKQTDEYKELHKNVEAIVDQYNYDDSDSMSDYYSVKFHSSVRIED